MAIHYDAKSGRFKDDSGRFVAKDRAWRSSIARKEFEDATRPKKPARKAAVPKQPAPAVAKKAAPAAKGRPSRAPVPIPPPKKPPTKAPFPVKKAPPKKAPPKSAKAPPSPKRGRAAPPPPPPPTFEHPSMREGIIDEFPEQWFPDPGSEDDFDWDDIADDWGDFEDADTTSAGPDGGES